MMTNKNRIRDRQENIGHTYLGLGFEFQGLGYLSNLTKYFKRKGVVYSTPGTPAGTPLVQ